VYDVDNFDRDSWIEVAVEEDTRDCEVVSFDTVCHATAFLG